MRASTNETVIVYHPELDDYGISYLSDAERATKDGWQITETFPSWDEAMKKLRLMDSQPAAPAAEE